MTFSTVFFDLDATLYPASCGLWPAIGKRIEAYLDQVMHFPTEEIPALKSQYYLTYGTTLRGLQIHYGIDPRAYLDFVHDLPVETYLQPDPDLKRMLGELSLPGWVFTNSDRRHSQRTLRALGIEDCFEGIIAIEELEFDCKPNPSAFRTALRIAGEPQPARVIFLDDSPRNVRTANGMGFNSILVEEAAGPNNPNHTISRPHDLRQLLPEIFKRTPG